jgi:propanediol dehydratase small subunit
VTEVDKASAHVREQNGRFQVSELFEMAKEIARREAERIREDYAVHGPIHAEFMALKHAVSFADSLGDGYKVSVGAHFPWAVRGKL